MDPFCRRPSLSWHCEWSAASSTLLSVITRSLSSKPRFGEGPGNRQKVCPTNVRRPPFMSKAGTHIWLRSRSIVGSIAVRAYSLSGVCQTIKQELGVFQEKFMANARIWHEDRIFRYSGEDCQASLRGRRGCYSEGCPSGVKDNLRKSADRGVLPFIQEHSGMRFDIGN